jgi:hypothetical protein
VGYRASSDDYRKREGRKLILKIKLGSKNAKLLLECTENEDTNKGINNLYITDLTAMNTNFM